MKIKPKTKLIKWFKKHTTSANLCTGKKILHETQQEIFIWKNKIDFYILPQTTKST